MSKFIVQSAELRVESSGLLEVLTTHDSRERERGESHEPKKKNSAEGMVSC